MSIPRDVQQFLDRYPDVERTDSDSNLRFYSNSTPCEPDGVLIEDILRDWCGDYDKLESKHGYIQWLFPIQEHGMNWDSLPLQVDELQRMKDNPIIVQRLLRAYQLMLDFYGMHLVSEDTGLLERSTNYGDRYRNLKRSSHNNLRISRILKCLSEFGFERLNAGFLLHVLNEQSENRQLSTPGIKSSMDRWWAHCLRNEEERLWIQGMIGKVRADDGFLFTRELYESALQKRQDTGSFEDLESS